MVKNKELLEQLQQMLGWKKSKSVYASRLGVTIEVLDELLEELRKQEKHETLEELSEFEATKFQEDIKKGEAELTFRSYDEIHNLEELIKHAKIDTDKWEISKYVQNYWGNNETPHYQVKAWLSKKNKENYGLEQFCDFLDKWKPKELSKVDKSSCCGRNKEEVDVELNIADFHLAKKTFEGDNLASKELDYFFTVNDLVSKIKANYNIRKLVFPISNDFFHTDNYQNTTTNGTPQDVTVWYDEEYEKGFDILANTINYLVTQAKEVEVVLVQGNHDRTKGFYVAHALEVFFKEYKNVKFQREHSITKSIVLGNTFIGYHHGNSCKLEALPLIFATGKDASSFGNAKYREIHTGDKHHYLAKEVQGVRIQQMPSLSKTDRWHRDNNFENKIHAALALVYHPENGKIAEFECRL